MDDPSHPLPILELPVTTIDRLVSDLPLSRVDFIKMDIEGSEQWALRGAQHTVERFRPRMAISLEHYSDADPVIPRQMRQQWPWISICGECDLVGVAGHNEVHAVVAFAH